jgi:hypothetical protein
MGCAVENTSKKKRIRSGKKTIKAENLKGRLIKYQSLRGIVGWNVQKEFGRVRPGPEDWLVYGLVLGPDRSGVPNLRVSVFDKDLLFDDRLGEAVTDVDGEFYILYRKSDFKDLFERQPDLYIKVMNRKGKILFTSEKAIRFKSDRVECFEIEIR